MVNSDRGSLMKFPSIGFEPFFSWVNRTRILYAPSVRKELAFELSQLGGSNVVLFTDKGVSKAGISQKIVEQISNSELKLAGIFDNIQQDARMTNINDGAEYYRSCGADCMVVVGGGSVMDTAKAVNILIGTGLDDFKPLAEQAGLWEDAKPLPPHIAFPTTAGTGCEVTNAMVVLDVESKSKLSVTHPYCNSDIAMLDPELTLSLPPKITAFTGMDALTHAIEGVSSVGAEPIADALGLHAIRLISKYLPIAVNEPENIEARGNMLIASTMAAMCFCNTMTGATHATAHALGALHGIPHGMANAIMLPLVMEFNIEECPERYAVIADALGLQVHEDEISTAASKSVQAIRELKELIGLTETLRDYGVKNDPEHFGPLVELAASDGQISYNPRYVEENDLLRLFNQAI